MRGLLDQQDVEAARGTNMLEHTDVLVATPQALAEVLAQLRPSASQALAAVVVDEADACFEVRTEGQRGDQDCRSEAAALSLPSPGGCGSRRS